MAAHQPGSGGRWSAGAAIGAGWLFVGTFPADVNRPVHAVAATVSLVLGNVGLLLSAGSMHRAAPLWLRFLASGTGVVGLLGCLALALPPATDAAGFGLCERVAVYSVSTFTVAAAAWWLRYAAARSTASAASP